jgi:hypothetical protein
MIKEKDWLNDPLMIDWRSYKPRLLKTSDQNRKDRWFSFHFATRLKLDGADYYCRQALGCASVSDRLGFPLLAHRLLEWSLGSFFFQLVSSYDTLLQEQNVIYANELEFNPEEVKWSKIKHKIPEPVVSYMEDERGKDWFIELRSFRNIATHQYVTPLSSMTTMVGEEPLDYSKHEVTILCMGKDRTAKSLKVDVCIDYLKQMANHVTNAWKLMASEFE